MGNIVTEMAMTKSREARIAIASAISATQTLVFAIEEAVTLNGHHLSVDQAKYILAIRAEADKVVREQ